MKFDPKTGEPISSGDAYSGNDDDYTVVYNRNQPGTNKPGNGISNQSPYMQNNGQNTSYGQGSAQSNSYGSNNAQNYPYGQNNIQNNPYGQNNGQNYSYGQKGRMKLQIPTDRIMASRIIPTDRILIPGTPAREDSTAPHTTSPIREYRDRRAAKKSRVKFSFPLSLPAQRSACWSEYS